MRPRPCLVGLDPPEIDILRSRFAGAMDAHESLPRMFVRDGQLFVEASSGFDYVPVSKVVFHGIFENDFDFITGLAIWGGPCLPNARAMMDCRLKLPCLARALALSRFAEPERSYVTRGAEFVGSGDRVAKWGNWHCGENKARFTDGWQAEEAAVIEPFLDGSAVRVALIGERAWQIQLEGDGWLKSIHAPTARFMELDAELVNDTRRVAAGFGLEVAANDYIVTPDGRPHLLEVNHIPNVTRFPELWDAYAEYALAWLKAS